MIMHLNRVTWKWKNGPARLLIKHSATHELDGYEYDAYTFRFWYGGELIFDNTCQISPSILRKDVFSLRRTLIMLALECVTLRPGDTDEEYFEDDTPEQASWRYSFACHDLGSVPIDMAEGNWSWSNNEYQEGGKA
jgi:hypothetical protein